MAYQSPSGEDDTGIDMVLFDTERMMDKWKALREEAKKQGLKHSDRYEIKNGLGRIGWVKGNVRVYLSMTSQQNWWILIEDRPITSFYSHQYKECVARLIEILKQYEIM